jgi:hypothetical protein
MEKRQEKEFGSKVQRDTSLGARPKGCIRFLGRVEVASRIVARGSSLNVVEAAF